MGTVSTTNALKRIKIFWLKPVSICFCPSLAQTTPARLLWKYQVGARSVHFNGIPFCIGKKCTLDFQYGTKYYKSKECSGSRVYLQGTRKIGCKAHIEMTEYILYPRYEVNTDQERVMSNKAMRRTKASRLSELRNALEQGEQTATTKKYFVVLPTAEAHHQSVTQWGEKWQWLRECIQELNKKYKSWCWRVFLTHLKCSVISSTMCVTLFVVNNLLIALIERTTLNFRIFVIMLTRQNDRYSCLFWTRKT